jgi:hypothetical protein
MKQLLFAIVLFVLLLPGIQKYIFSIPEPPLHGALKLIKADSLTKQGWFSGEFQKQFYTAINDGIGFKSTLIRFNNQVNYSLFGLSSVSTIVVGKSGYLFEESYINAFTGKDILKHEELRKKISYLYQIQTYLEKRGIHFLFVFEPSKARVYEEFLPDHYLALKNHRSNYSEYLRIIHKEFPGLHYMDANAYFQQLKTTINYPLYTKGGTHWNHFVVENYFMDTLFSYIGAIQHESFPKRIQTNLIWTNKLQSPDDDIRSTMNLMFSDNSQRIPYSDFRYVDNPAFKKPDLLVIADSYYWHLYGTQKFYRFFNRNDFWFYNKTRYPKEYYKGTADPAFLTNDLLQHNIVILMVTETNLWDMFLFPETTLSWFGLDNNEIKSVEVKRQERIKFYLNGILANPEWLKDLKGHVTKDKPLKQVMQEAAEYMVQTESKGK